jgi:hypothetical protein
MVTDESLFLERFGGHRNVRPGNAEHLSNIFLSQRNLIGIDTIRSSQQPIGETLLYGVKMMTNCGLRNLQQDAVQITHDKLLKFFASEKFLSQNFRLNFWSGSFNLNRYLIRCCGRLQKSGDANESSFPVTPIATDFPLSVVESTEIIPPRGK